MIHACPSFSCTCGSVLGNALAQMVQRYKHYSGKWPASTIQSSLTSLRNLANIVVGREYSSVYPVYRAALYMLHQNRHNWKPRSGPAAWPCFLQKVAYQQPDISSCGSLAAVPWCGSGLGHGCWDKRCGNNIYMLHQNRHNWKSWKWASSMAVLFFRS